MGNTRGGLAPLMRSSGFPIDDAHRQRRAANITQTKFFVGAALNAFNYFIVEQEESAPEKKRKESICCLDVIAIKR